MPIEQSMLRISILFATLFATDAVFAWSLFGPKTYEDCVMSKLDQMQTPLAVSLLEDTCRKMFPDKVISRDPSAGLICHQDDITKEEAEKIKIQDSGSYGRQLWNDNEFTVIDLAVNIKYEENGPGYFAQRKVTNKNFGSVNPKTAVNFHDVPGYIKEYSIINAKKSICQ